MTITGTEYGAYMFIAIAALLTYATRIGGYLIVARIQSLPARVEAGLNAVPAAVITTLVAPAVFSGTWREALALAIAGIVGLRAGPLTAVTTSTLSLIALRAVAAA